MATKTRPTPDGEPEPLTDRQREVLEYIGHTVSELSLIHIFHPTW